MTVQVVTLDLPGPLYERLKEIADASHRDLDEVLITTIQAGMPPSLERVPERFQADLRALDHLSDDVLWQIARAEMDDDKAALYEELLERNRRKDLSDSERKTLSALREEADLLMLRRSYAHALLRWRGHIIPTPGGMQEV